MRALTRRVTVLAQPSLRTAQLLAPTSRALLRPQRVRLLSTQEQKGAVDAQQKEEHSDEEHGHAHAHGGPGHEAHDPVLHEEFNKLKAQVDKMVKEQKKLECTAKEHKDDWMRALAEMQTVRNRARADVEAAKQFGVQSFAKSMLDVADTLRLSLAQLEKDAEQTQDPLLKQMYDGIVMTEKVLQQAFERAGIKRLDAVGEEFDPHKHEFVAALPVEDEAKDGKVAEVVHDGYMLHQRLLRPAKVVSYKKQPKPSS